MHSMDTLDKGIIHAQGGCSEMAGNFIMLLRMVCNVKIMISLFLEFFF